MALNQLKPSNPIGGFISGRQAAQNYRLAEQEAQIGKEKHTADLNLKTLEGKLKQKQMAEKERQFRKDLFADIGQMATYASMGETPEEQTMRLNKGIDFYVQNNIIPEEEAAKYRDINDIPTLAALADPNQQEVALQKLKAKAEMPKQSGVYTVQGRSQPMSLAEDYQGRLIDPTTGENMTPMVTGKAPTREQVETGPPGSFGKTKTQTGKAITNLEDYLGQANRSFRQFGSALSFADKNPQALGTPGGAASFFNEVAQSAKGLIGLAGIGGGEESYTEFNDVSSRNSEFIDNAFRETAVDNAQLKSLLTSMAYAKSKLEDPSGRVTDADFKLNLKSLAGDSSDPVVFSDVLKRTVSDMYDDALFKLEITQIPEDQKSRLMKSLENSFGKYFKESKRNLSNSARRLNQIIEGDNESLDDLFNQLQGTINAAQ